MAFISAQWRRIRYVALICLFAAPAPTTAEPHPLDGIWYSRAYGEILSIRRGKVTAYDINPAVCSRRASKAGARQPIRDPQRTGDIMDVQSPTAVTRIRFTRLRELPPACSDPQRESHDPLLNFDAFWSWFDQNYAFFQERGVNWATARSEFRPLASKASDSELLKVFRAMLATLHDRHTFVDTGEQYINASLSPTFERWFAEFRKDNANLDGFSEFLRQRSRITLRRSWAKNLDAGSVRQLGQPLVVGSGDHGRIAYLQVLAESGFSETDGADSEVAAATEQLDTVFAGFTNSRGLILDLRFNFGGSDEIGLVLAGLLTPTDRPGFTKCTRDGTGFSPRQQLVVRTRRAAFTRPVVILSGTDNVSAGENLAMIARTYPNVIVIGDMSAGVHSDVLEKTLPNGWTIGISNEVFISPDGTMYETVGVPPDIFVPFDSATIELTGDDPPLEKALELLRERDFHTALQAKRAALGRRPPC